MSVSQAVLELLVKMKDEASSGLASLTSSLGGLGTIAGGAALAGVVALGGAIIGGMGDAQQARELYASTQQTIDTMGNAAGRSAQQVVDMASALSDASGKSLFGDDQIQQSENLLLTFGEIKGATFDAATALTVDLAQALGGAPKDQAMMLGKALNDPIHGMSALGKAGLTFSEEQKAAITAMQESGDMAGAQAIIIAELNKQVGGQAAAAAAAKGGWFQFKAGLGETFETIGGKLLPVLDMLGAWLASPAVQAAIAAVADALANGIGVAVEWLATTAIPALMQAWTDMEPTVTVLIAFLRDTVAPILLWIANVLIAGLKIELVALGWAWTNILLPAIRTAWAFLSTYIIPVLSAIFVALRDDLPRGIAVAVAGWETFKTTLASFKEAYLDPIGRGFTYVVDSVASAQKQFNDFIAGVQGAIIPAWLQGHSPPPLANWFSDIASSATDAGGAMQGAVPTGGSLPVAVGAGAGGGGGAAVNVYITVQGSVAVVRDLALELRDELNKLGMRNVSIFSDTVNV